MEEEKTTPTEGDAESTPPTGGGDQFDRKMYPAKCSECQADTEVPFEPDPDRPVFCRDCYAKRKPPRRDFN